MLVTDVHYRILVESVADYAIFFLDPDGIVQTWNPGAQRIKGYAPSEIIGRHFSTFYTESDRAAGIPDRGLATARETGRFQDIGWRVRKDGTAFWASVVLTALHDASGTLIGFGKVTRDLTDTAYRQFVEATNGIVWTTDAQGRPNADSPSWRAFTGQTEAEWRGMEGWAPLHPEDEHLLREAWPRAKVNKSVFTAEFRLRRHDGVYVWMTCRATPLLLPDGRVREWFGVTFDITERKAAELARERALETWRTTLRSIGDGVIATDPRGRITFMNPIAEQLTGWSSAEATGRTLVDVFPIVNEDSREVVENPVDRVLREGKIVGLANHTLLVRRDRSEIAIDDSAAPILDPDGSLQGVVLVFRDATHEKREEVRRTFLARAGEELMQAADYRTALEHIATLAVPRLADWCAVDIVEVGAAVPTRLAVAHVDPAKVQWGYELEKRYPADPNAATGLPNVLRTGQSELYPEIPAELLEAGAVDEEHRRIIRELDLRSAMVVPLKGRERTFGAITFIYTGDARRYTAEDLAFAEELARRAAIVVERRRLEEEARMASQAKDEFLAMLGHELRNPLAPIRTALQLMSIRGDLTNARERAVIERQVNHLVTLVDDLLDVSRITRGKIELEREPIEIGTVIARALEMASPLFEQRRHRLDLAVPRTGLVVRGDPARLAQVFANLLTNAAKYTDPEGLVAITAKRVDGANGPEVCVAVTDSGIGISPEMIGSIFDMFVQERQGIERSQGGLGLGLAIVRSLVLMHGGTVDVASAGRGAGSTFTVRLPLEETAMTRPTPNHPLETPGGAGARIVLVDDNEDAVLMLEEILRHDGHEVHVAHDGAAALELIGRVRPDLALLDIGLPVMDGYELAERLHADLGDACPKLVAVTGYGQEKDQSRAATAGFVRHLVKPVEIATLRSVIDELRPR